MRGLAFALILCSLQLAAQTDSYTAYINANVLLRTGLIKEARPVFRQLEERMSDEDTLYAYVLWYYTATLTELEERSRLAEDWSESLKLAKEALGVIEKGKPYFDRRFKQREYWMTNNMIVSYFGLNKLEKAKQLQEKLHKAYAQYKLPKGIKEYYNFEYFKQDSLNVWGYEMYPKPDGSSKILYFIYNTHADGTDYNLQYSLELIKKGLEKEYQLTIRKNEELSALQTYTYPAPLDYSKLREDVRQVVSNRGAP